MAKKPARTWGMVFALGPLLAVVVIAAMWASFTALIDVARVNGVVVPALLPIVVDVGMIASNVASVYFRTLGLKGRALATVIFVGFASVSMYANITHAWLSADFSKTSIVTAVIIAAIFPAGQLGVTHMVMMLIPDQKERARLQRERQTASEAAPIAASETRRSTPATTSSTTLSNTVSGNVSPGLAPALHAVPQIEDADHTDDETRRRVLEYVEAEGKRPTGTMVSQWRGGGDRRTGTRFMKQMEKDGLLKAMEHAEPRTPPASMELAN